MSTTKLSLSFRIFKNEQLVREEKLNQGVIKIGKVPSAHLRLDDELVSRMHAIIEVLGPEVSVIDLGSTGGTFVNDKKVNKAKLQAGDKIRVGESTIEIVAMTDVNAVAAVPSVPSVIVAPALIAPAVRVAPPALPKPVAPKSTTTSNMPAVAPVMPVATAFARTESMPMDEGGAKAVEVAAMLGDSVVDVKHCVDPRGGKVTPLTWAFAAGGLACLIASASAFAVSVNNAATNKAAFEHHTKKLNKPAHAFRPVPMSAAVDGIAFGGLALGLFGLTTGLTRSRRERKSPFYRIGTAPDVQQPVENAPSPSFPLVAPSGDDFVFNYAPGIEGELTTADGKTTSLAELASTGRARPSATAAGAIEVPIPMAAKIRARAGQTTFLVSGVSKPAASATSTFAPNSRNAAYTAGSLVAHLGIVAILYSLPYEGSNVNVDLANIEDSSLRSVSTASLETPPEQDPDKTGDGDPGAENTAAPMKLDSGEAGKPSATRTNGHIALENRNVEPRLSREQAIEAARTAGFLGSAQVLRGGITSLTATDPFSSGFDVADIHGPLIGSDGEGRGNFGFGRHGFGPGGGCTMEPCGIIGLKGPYSTIGTGDKAGDGWRGGGSWGDGRRRNVSVPNTTTIGMPTAGSGLDKAIIKRYIKRNLAKIAYCYESELLARPGIQGNVQVGFLISGTGSVQSATGAGFDGKVASCVASVIKNISFPATSDGSSVQVNYPFTFHAAGSN